MSALELSDIGFTYRGAATAALTKVDLRMGSGQMHVILGAVGSGTSTLARVITGLVNEQGTITGDIRVPGSAVMMGDDPEAQLSGMTSLVRDEVQLPGRLHGDEANEVAANAALVLTSLGIAELWDRRLDALSGGQRQLVAIAGLLTLRPSLLVLDQPSLSLDPETRARLGTVLHDYCSGGGAVLITAHQLDELTEASHHMSILGSGQLIPRDKVLSAQALERYGIWDTRPPSTHPQDRTSTVELIGEEPAALNVCGLRVTRGGTTVLNGVDLTVDSGQLVSIMGSNGAGKSTLLRGLLGLLGAHAETSGTITVAGHGTWLRLGDIPANERAHLLGWVGQDPGSQLSAATVREELMRAVPLPAHRRRDRRRVRAHRREAVASAMVEAQLTEVSETHPYDLSIDRRKDLVMASALLTSPRVLLLDEPTLGRDRMAIDRLNAFIQGFLRRGGSVLATAHDLNWAQGSDRILHLRGGQLYADNEKGKASWTA